MTFHDTISGHVHSEGVFDFSQYFQFLVTTILVLGLALSTVALVFNEILYYEFSLKFYLIALSLLVLLEIILGNKSIKALCILTAILVLVSYSVFISSSWFFPVSAIILLHATQISLWSQLKIVMSKTSPRIVFLYAWSVIYVSASSYTRIYADHFITRYLATLIVSTTMTLILLITSSKLREFERVDSVVLDIAGKITSKAEKVVRISLNAENTILKIAGKIASRVKRSVELLFNTEFKSKIRDAASRLFLPIVKQLDKAIVSLELLTARNFEIIFSKLVKSTRILEDIVVEKIRVEIVKTIRQLHYLFEYSLATVSLILCLLILLALIVYVITAP